LKITAPFSSNDIGVKPISESRYQSCDIIFVSS